MEHQDELLLKKRIIDLSRSANRKNIVTFSNFLNLNELNLFHQVKADMETACQLSGGYENAERQMIAFIPDALYYDWDFPIVCLHFTPAYPKYAEELTHRDVLGALMNLGIERAKIGDIRLGPTDYYVFASESISDYILDSLAQIRHTIIRGEVADTASLHIEGCSLPIIPTVSAFTDISAVCPGWNSAGMLFGSIKLYLFSYPK